MPQISDVDTLFRHRTAAKVSPRGSSAHQRLTRTRGRERSLCSTARPALRHFPGGGVLLHTHVASASGVWPTYPSERYLLGTVVCSIPCWCSSARPLLRCSMRAAFHQDDTADERAKAREPSRFTDDGERLPEQQVRTKHRTTASRPLSIANPCWALLRCC